MSDNKLFDELEKFVAERYTQRKPKKQTKKIELNKVKTSNPWDFLTGNLKDQFDSIVKSDRESEARKEKGRPKSEYEIKQDAWRIIKNKFESTCLINESNLAMAFNHYSDDELVELIISKKKFIRLVDGKAGYRIVEIENVSRCVAEDEEFTKYLAPLAFNDKDKLAELVQKRVRAIIKADIAQIKVEWSDLLTGA